MIVSCAPFRVSFAGGGSDIAQFYRQQRGAVLSCAIAKYAFVVIHNENSDRIAGHIHLHSFVGLEFLCNLVRNRRVLESASPMSGSMVGRSAPGCPGRVVANPGGKVNRRLWQMSQRAQYRPTAV